jgi:hypothetical protein
MHVELRQPAALDVWRPVGFDPRDVLPSRLWRHIGAVQYVVGLVATGAVFCAARQKERLGWVPLRSEDMERFFGRSGTWPEVRRVLLSRGILECDEVYRKGEKAKWYRLGQGWRGCGVEQVGLVDARLLARVAEWELERKDRGEWKPVHEHIARWLSEFRVDEASTWRWVCQRGRSWGQHLTDLKIKVIQSGKARPIVDHYGRVHSPVTSLRRTVRFALRVGDRQLSEVDVGSCQPLILAFVVGKIVVGDWSLDDVRRLGSDESIREPFANLPMERWRGDLPGDLIDFLEVCQSGRFYDTLGELWGCSARQPMGKDAIKRLTFRRILFGRVVAGNRFWEAFSSRWPGVAEVLEALKRGDHGNTSRASQRIESLLMIEGVIGRFLENHPHVPIAPIHDSVLVPSDFADTAASVITGEFERIGLRPLIKRKQQAAA